MITSYGTLTIGLRTHSRIGSDTVNLFRLFDIIHQESKLYLVFEFLDLDLKKYMDNVANAPAGNPDGLSKEIVRVSGVLLRKRPQGLTNTLCHHCSTEIHLPTHPRHLLLPRPSNSASRSQTSKSADRQGGQPEAGRFRPGPRFRYPIANLHP